MNQRLKFDKKSDLLKARGNLLMADLWYIIYRLSLKLPGVKEDLETTKKVEAAHVISKLMKTMLKNAH